MALVRPGVSGRHRLTKRVNPRGQNSQGGLPNRGIPRAGGGARDLGQRQARRVPAIPRGGAGGGRGGGGGRRIGGGRGVPPGIGPAAPLIPEGLGGAYNAGTTMEQIARNEWLNTLPVDQRALALNAMGYWTGGVPAAASQMRAPSQAYMSQLEEPGIYQVQTDGVYQGQVTVGPNGERTWQPFAAPGQAGGRRVNPRRNYPGPTPGGLPNRGVPGAGGRFGRGAGGANRGDRGRPGGVGGQAGQGRGRIPPRFRGAPGAEGVQAPGVAAPPAPAPTGGLPLTGAGEQGQRLAEDQLAAQLSQLGVARDQIEPFLELFRQRIGTQQGLDKAALDESLVGRGIYNSSIRGEDQFNLDTLYDRQRQDAAIEAAGQYADIDQQAAEAYGEYGRQLQELWLNISQGFAEEPSPVLGAGGLGGGGGRGGGGGGGGGRGGGRNQSGRRGGGNRNAPPRGGRPARNRARGRR